jgi:hypothetical protein
MELKWRELRLPAPQTGIKRLQLPVVSLLFHPACPLANWLILPQQESTPQLRSTNLVAVVALSDYFLPVLCSRSLFLRSFLPRLSQ